MSEKRMASFYDSARLCWKRQCEECPLSEYNNGLECGCGTYKISYPDIANEIILKWCDEHPVKTYKEDFMLHFPNCEITPHGAPICCRNDVFNTKDCIGDCVQCWNTAKEKVEYDCNIRYKKNQPMEGDDNE